MSHKSIFDFVGFCALLLTGVAVFAAEPPETSPSASRRCNIKADAVGISRNGTMVFYTNTPRRPGSKEAANRKVLVRIRIWRDFAFDEAAVVRRHGLVTGKAYLQTTDPYSGRLELHDVCDVDLKLSDRQLAAELLSK